MTDYDREQLALIAEATRRKRSDPVGWFLANCTPAQGAIIHSPSLYNGVVAGNRSGKSATVAVDLSLKLLNRHPTVAVPKRPVRLVLLAPTRKQIAEIWRKKLLTDCELHGPHVPDFILGKPFLPPSEIERVGWDNAAGVRTPTEIVMRNGNSLIVYYTDNPQQWRRFQGPQYDWIYADEGCMSGDMHNELYGRLQDAQSDNRVVGYGGVTWAATETDASYAGFQAFKELCLDGQHPDHRLHELNALDNPAITKEVRARAAAAWGEEEAAVRLGGGSAVNKLLVYPQFDDKRHVLAADFTPGPDDCIWISYDPGVMHPTGILFAVFTKREPFVLNVWRYIEHKRKTVEYDADIIANVLAGRFAEGIILDPASKKKEKTTGDSVQNMLIREISKRGIEVKTGFRTCFGINSHKHGIAEVRMWLAHDRIRISPSVESGGKLAAHQLRKYRFKEGTIYRDIGEVVKKEDEFPDVLRYLVRVKASYIERGRNLPRAPRQPGEGAQPQPEPPSDAPMTTEQLHLKRSADMVRMRFSRQRRHTHWLG